MSIEKKLIKKEWEDFDKEVERCKDCENPVKRPEEYCNYHQEVYRNLIESVI